MPIQQYIDAGTYPIRERGPDYHPKKSVYQWYDHMNEKFYGLSFSSLPEAYYMRVYLGFDPRLIRAADVWFSLKKEALKKFSEDRVNAIKQIEAHSGESLVEMYKSMELLEEMAAQKSK